MLQLHRSCVLLLVVAAYGQETGSQACFACHANIASSYLATPMAQSSGRVGTGALREGITRGVFRSPEGSVEYRVARDADRLVLHFRQRDISGSRRLDYFIGSGAVGRSYLSSIGGFLFQAPSAYYSAPAQWDLSPGYEKTEEVQLLRPLEPRCLGCHTSGIQHLTGTATRYADPPFQENGVSCERCHGPGRRHIEQMRAGQKPLDTAIVNPAKLEPARRDSVCAQCHLSGATEIDRAGAAPFRPGGILSDSTITFVWRAADRNLPVISHSERMTQSQCWKASDTKLWCGSCHDPHRLPAVSTRIEYYRSRCLQCHTDESCNAPLKARTVAANSCIACHMPTAPVKTVKHAVYTDHSIPRNTQRGLGAPAPAAVPSDAELIPFGGGKAGDREFGLAYASLAIQENNRALGMRAFELLKKSYEEQPRDWKVASQLAQLYDRMKNTRKACELYASAVASNPDAIAPAVNLGACLANEGRIEESIRLWKGAIERSPGLEAARFNLAVAYQRTGDTARARSTLEHALRFNPASERARTLLREIAPSRRSPGE